MKLFCFDFETFVIAPYLQAPPIVCMSYTIDDGAPQLVHVRDSSMAKLIEDALDERDCVMVAHNAAFEALCIMAQWPRLTTKLFAKLDQGKLYCTQVAQRLIHISLGQPQDRVSLKDSLWYHPSTAHIDLDKECWWRVRYGLLINTPCELWPQDAVDYAIGDTSVRELYYAQTTNYAEAVADNTARTVTTQSNTQCFVPGRTWVSVMLALDTAAGFPTDRTVADMLVERTEGMLAEYRDQLMAAGMLQVVVSKGVPKYTMPKKPAEQLMIAAYAAMGRDAPRNPLTPAALVKAYKSIGFEVEAERDHKGDYKDLTEDDLAQARENGVPEELLIGSVCLDEEACRASRHPLLMAYSAFGSAGKLRQRSKQLQKPMIQGGYTAVINTGRTSSNQGRQPKPGEPYMAYGTQIQNLPRD